MKYLFSILPLLFLLTARTCDRKVVEDEGPVYQLGETLKMDYGKKMTIKSEGLSLIYSSIQDSRCPEDAQCIRAGEAVIGMTLELAGNTSNATLEAKGLCMDRSGKCGSSAAAMGYAIQLLSADPYPQSNVEKVNEATSVSVIVTKK